MDNQEKNINELFSESRKREPENDTLGLVSMILGITGLLFSFCCTFMAVLPGIAALVCGAIAKNNGQKYALSGIILGLLTIITGVALTIIGMR